MKNKKVKKSQKIEMPSEVEVQEKMKEILAKKSKILNEKKEERKKRKSPTQDFLKKINPMLREFINEGASYRDLREIIFENFSIKISEQTIRVYAQNVLGIEAQKSDKKNVKEIVEKSDMVSSPVPAQNPQKEEKKKKFFS